MSLATMWRVRVFTSSQVWRSELRCLWPGCDTFNWSSTSDITLEIQAILWHYEELEGKTSLYSLHHWVCKTELKTSGAVPVPNISPVHLDVVKAAHCSQPDGDGFLAFTYDLELKNNQHMLKLFASRSVDSVPLISTLWPFRKTWPQNYI